ncbi:adenylate/guanylate cyclase domain-containing protein [Aeromicrobium sp. 50.2.37]|uniref:adenylate/guanylate cyclase domain-containing protein n=1 Tax=Aeromicrobium sp. 50.2.37 TaxID=2969305 RepID=UPI00214FBC6D|nr:adenylate/guanylate cyclase domain-containing protein [Aeromicrobium sp. 50.2.37]MCR4513445.1 adenylate/guanylate cyclase domain-containing protein [Aeromicrobium sp. 50.2.37]
MSVLEIVLSVTCAALAVSLVVAWGLLLGARRRIAQLKRSIRTERPRIRLVPTPSDAVRTVVGTAISLKDKGLSGTLRGSIDDLARWADVERPDLARMASRDGTVAILFSDIEGSTALNHALGDRGWVQLLSRHDAVVNRAVSRHGGYVIKTQGDGFMVAFTDAAQAVAAAAEVQRRITRARPGSRLSGVAVRIGVHQGSAVHRDGDLFGRNVAYAARVAAQAEGGEVLVSDGALESLEQTHGDDRPAVLESREVDLKGIPGTQVVHAIDWKV